MIRFDHKERNGRGYKGSDRLWSKESLGIAVNTPTPHSCLLCGNMRDLEGPTLQERRHFLDKNDVLIEQSSAGYYGSIIRQVT
jgi:hypothetical protein